MKFSMLGLIASICLVSSGCDGLATSNPSPIGVVDLDAVAQRLGRDKQILQLIEQRQTHLNETLVATQNSLIEQLNRKKSEFGELSTDEAKQLAQLQNQANSILTSTKNQALTNLTTFQQETVDRFRAEAKPIIMELAASKGVRIVLSKNDSVVFAFDTTIDLTDEVFARMKSQSPANTSSNSNTLDSKASPKQAAATPSESRTR